MSRCETNLQPELLTRLLPGRLAIAGSTLLVLCALGRAAEFQFDFGSGALQPGYTQITPQMIYSGKQGFGFVDSAAAPPNQPRVFAVDVEEGNYDVTMRFGDAKSA